MGFEHAGGDMLMILDADLSVAPEDLRQFYEAMVSGAGEFVMGSRLVYTMDPRAMRFLNLLGNRFFGLLLSVLVGQHIKDTLCGTKVIWRKDYAHLAAERAHFDDFDPYGDFDLTFGAAKLNLRIVEIPVRYRERAHLRRPQHSPLRRRLAPPPHVRAGRGASLPHGMSEAATLARHRAAWQARPELHAAYREWFDRLLAAAGTRRPVVEIGSGPGFFKAAAPTLVATDVLAGLAVDIRCDAEVLPFRSGSVGAIVMVDALHHLPRPLDFLAEAARALTPGGRLAMVEPWITLPSWILYRFFHHEECRLGVDVARPFASEAKGVLEGNAAIPYLVLARLRYTW
jgi:Methyltransferase domain/Glycosyl transferase family 2